MHLDKNILQSKTVCNIMKTLKDAGTITKTGSNDCIRINEDIQTIVRAHTKAMNKTKFIRDHRENKDIVKEYIRSETRSNYKVRW